MASFGKNCFFVVFRNISTDVFLPKLSPANILGLNVYRKSSKGARQNKLLGLGVTRLVNGRRVNLQINLLEGKKEFTSGLSEESLAIEIL